MHNPMGEKQQKPPSSGPTTALRCESEEGVAKPGYVPLVTSSPGLDWWLYVIGQPPGRFVLEREMR